MQSAHMLCSVGILVQLFCLQLRSTVADSHIIAPYTAGWQLIYIMHFSLQDYMILKALNCTFCIHEHKRYQKLSHGISVSFIL